MSKYLFIATNEWAWGGSEILWSKTAERLASRGLEVRASVPQFASTTDEVERLQAAGSRIVYRKPSSLAARFVRRLLPLRNYQEQHIRSAGSGADLTVISQGSATDGLAWMEAAHALGFKYAVIVQGASPSQWPDDETADRLGVAFNNAVRSYFVSEATLDLCRRQFGSALCGARVIRNPFNVRYDACPPWPTDESDCLSLACVGRLEVISKGQDVLLEVLALPHWRERRLRVALVGTGVHERSLRRRADELKLSSIDFTGHIADIETLWSKHHALVLPSRHEGMPLVVVEAMLCARACLATDVGGNRELIRDGINGFLAKAPTVELLGNALDRLWQERGRLREMGQRAAIDVRQWVSSDPVEDFAQELRVLVDRAGCAT